MQTANSITPFDLSLAHSDRFPESQDLQAAKHAVKATDWDRIIARADQITQIAGTVGLVLSGIYFVPYLLAILLR